MHQITAQLLAELLRERRIIEEVGSEIKVHVHDIAIGKFRVGCVRDMWILLDSGDEDAVKLLREFVKIWRIYSERGFVDLDAKGRKLVILNEFYVADAEEMKIGGCVAKAIMCALGYSEYCNQMDRIMVKIDRDDLKMIREAARKGSEVARKILEKFESGKEEVREAQPVRVSEAEDRSLKIAECVAMVAAGASMDSVDACSNIVEDILSLPTEAQKRIIELLIKIISSLSRR